MLLYRTPWKGHKGRGPHETRVASECCNQVDTGGLNLGQGQGHGLNGTLPCLLWRMPNSAHATIHTRAVGVISRRVVSVSILHTTDTGLQPAGNNGFIEAPTRTAYAVVSSYRLVQIMPRFRHRSRAPQSHTTAMYCWLVLRELRLALSRWIMPLQRQRPAYGISPSSHPPAMTTVYLNVTNLLTLFLTHTLTLTLTWSHLQVYLYSSSFSGGGALAPSDKVSLATDECLDCNNPTSHDVNAIARYCPIQCHPTCTINHRIVNVKSRTKSMPR